MHELRSFALTLKFYSAKAYEYVHDKFDLIVPHRRKIRTWYNPIDSEPVFARDAFVAMKLKAKTAKVERNELLSALMLDEMPFANT